MRSPATAALVIALASACFDAPTMLDDASDDGDDEPTVVVRGKLIGRWGEAASTSIAGVKVELLGDPDVFVVTADDGTFALEGVPAGTPAYLAARPSATYLGGIVGVDVPYQDVDEVQLLRPAKLDVQQVSDALAMQQPGTVIDTALGGISAIASKVDTVVTIAPTVGQHYAIGADGAPMLGADASTNVVVPAVIFFNLGAHAAGELELGATHPAASCTVPLPHPPVEPDHMTVVTIACE